MTRYVFRRLVEALPTVALVAILAFGLLRMAPGDPALIMVGPSEATPELLAAIRSEYGLDESLAQQFLLWGARALQGDLGPSITHRRPVMDLILERLPTTLELAAVALILAAAIGIPLGIVAALRQGRTVDSAVRVFSLVGVSIPNFIFGVLLVMIFGWYVPGLLPYEHWVPLRDGLRPHLEHLLLPALALALTPMAIVARLARSSMLDVLSRDYVTMATALGVPRLTIIWVDALKNALLPVLTVLGLVAAHLVGGAVVTETVFNISGLGRLLFEALLGRDYPLVAGNLLFLSLMVIAANLGVDLIYAIVNPRIRQAYVGPS